jgi:hypothetical protein
MQKHHSFRQIAFDVNWLDKYGYMTGAFPLLEEADRSNLVYVGYQLLNDMTLPEGCGDDSTRSMVYTTVRDIYQHTTHSQWNHAMSFRIGQGEIIQEMVYHDRYHPGKARFTQVNAVARIRPHQISIYAVDRDWKRLDSDIAELKRLAPYVKYDDPDQIAWIDSMAFPDYCPLYFGRWMDHLGHHFDQLWSAFAQRPDGSTRGIHAAFAEGTAQFARANRAVSAGSEKDLVMAHQQAFLKKVVDICQAIAVDRVIEGLTVHGAPCVGFYSTDEEYERLYPQALSLIQNVPIL